MRQSDFPVLKKNLIYLDNSSMTQKPKVVIESLVDFYENYNANVHRGIHDLSEQSTMAFEKAHETVAGFIHANVDEIIFTSGTTQSINMLARMLEQEINEGDEILLTIMEHHSNLVPWQEVARRKKATLRFIPLGNDYQLDLDKVKELITEKTKVLAITHLSNVLGTINPVQELAKLVHQHGGYLVLDAAQSAAHLPLDVKKLDCDFMAFSGHKMLGPTGIGVLYGKKELLIKFQPVVFGGGMVHGVDLNEAKWADLPQKFEAGTPHIAGAIGLARAIEYLQEIGMKKIKEEGKEICCYIFEKLSELEGVNIIGPENLALRAPIFSFTVEGIHPHDIAEILNKGGIAVRAGHHCTMPLMKSLGFVGLTRASFYIYNTKEDVDSLVQGIKKVQEVFR